VICTDGHFLHEALTRSSGVVS